MNFTDLNLDPKIQQKIHTTGFTELTNIQQKCIPHILNNKDVVGQAETGSGKTLAFCLPILEKIHPNHNLQVVILTPTRELCQQVTLVFKDFGRPKKIKTASIYGGVSITPQIKKIKTAEIIVGTPGRMLDHIRRKTINFSNLRFLVLDETDKMLDMGFIEDVEAIITHMPHTRQTLMFSATIEHTLHHLMKKHLQNPIIIKTQSQVDKTKLHQIYYDIYNKNDKFSLLVHLLKNDTSGLAIVFCATRKESDIVARNLRHHGIRATAIHGGMSQHQRTQSLHKLKNEVTEVLVATDVAARGLDIKNISHIYNYDVPKTPIEYIHRIGRTARAGENGIAITLLTEPDHDNFRRVQSNEDLQIKKAAFPEFKKIRFFRKTRRRKQTTHTKHVYNSHQNKQNNTYHQAERRSKHIKL